jgi:hypothetical protein
MEVMKRAEKDKLDGTGNHCEKMHKYKTKQANN